MEENKNLNSTTEELEETEENEIVELTDESGRVLKFYHIDSMDYEGRWFAFFLPAEEMEGVDPEEVVIFEITGPDGEEVLVPVEDEALLDRVFNEFCRLMDECEDGCDCEDENCDCHHHHHD